MRLDQFSNPIFDERDLFNAMYSGHELSGEMFVDGTTEIKQLEAAMGAKFWLPLDDYPISVEEYDAAMQADWYMPAEYKTMDIEEHLTIICPKENKQRLAEELEEFRSRDMIHLLRWLKYFVDTCEKQGVVWGVGRGSSVASYVLYLLGVHSIDPIKYNLDWREFLR